MRSPCSAAETERGPWALSHAWAGPAWLSEGPWLEVTGETRIQLNAAGLLDIRCSGARCEFVISNYKIEIIILLVSFLIFVAIVTMHLLDM